MDGTGAAVTVGDVMAGPVTTIGVATGVKAAAAVLRASGFSALPVVDATGAVAGIVSEADVLAALDRGQPALLAGDLMSRPAVTVDARCGVAEAARLMHHCGLGRLPVVDGAGRITGIVSRGDLLKVFLCSDDELRRRVEERIGAADLASVKLTVEAGVISMYGSEGRPGRASRIARAIEAVEGVVAVRNNLSSASAAPD
jgi:CBS domain-containing protein